MKKYIDKNLLYSEPARIIFSAILIVSILLFFWDIYKYKYFHNKVDINRLYIDIVDVGVSFFLYELFVKKTLLLNSLFRRKVGYLPLWVIIIVYTMYSFKFPLNVIVLIVILTLPALYFLKKHYKKDGSINNDNKKEKTGDR